MKIMLREGLTYSHFDAVAKLAFAESAVKDFGSRGVKHSASSVCALTGLSHEQLVQALTHESRQELHEYSDVANPSARVLHGWHNDKEYVGPYGFPIDIPFLGDELSVTALTARHAPGVSPHVVLEELKRINAVKEVGTDVWKPLVSQYIEPGLSAENIRRMGSLVESLLSTLEFNTRGSLDGAEFFERTMIVDAPLTNDQFQELQQYLRVVGAQFLNRIDAFAAVDLRKKIVPRVSDTPSIRAGLESFLYVESEVDEAPIKDFIDLTEKALGKPQ